MAVRAHGWSRNIPTNSVLGNTDTDKWMEKFTFFTQGYNLRPLEISAAVGLTQLSGIENFLHFRRSNALYLQQVMSNFPWLHLQKQSAEGSWMAFGFVIKQNKIERKKLVDHLSELDFETRPIGTGNFLRQPVIDSLKQDVIIEGSFPGADEIHFNGFMLGNHGRDLRSEIDLFAESLRSFIRKY